MSPKTTNLAIMFADISGSTRLFEVLGDATARVTVSDTLELLTKVIHLHNGTVIKTIGDEIMCTFPTADDSANAANEMQETLEDANEMRDEGPEIKIRVGMHFGPALLEGGDVFGDAVNVAARMAAQAKGGQIITTKTTVDLLEPIMRASTRFVDRAPIKGKKEDIEIFEIIWQEEDVTRMATGMLQEVPKVPQVSLHVNYKGQTVTLNQDRSGLVMGRSQACDLPINEKLASRQHVRIELRRNKFFIIDQSTNGTHIRMDNSDDAFLRREEMPITANGQISLGKSFSEGPTEVVAFTLETS
ncbi:MAG: adenylate/guanylate cyclase domain-containing protein [Proteobacteria bacterium]|nr:adenylate/guanylate cyclase domain-containing protein [Pseudomonadota bacterium]